MELVLLKSSACLLAFIAFYKVFLERTSNHQFKRYYLLTVILISIGIPFITIIEYIEPTFALSALGYPMANPINETLPNIETSNHLPFILWSIYGVGLALLSFRFVFNLGQIILKIKRNPKKRNSNFINVLLQDVIPPHTFFNYIFLNKTKFENKEIPKEVILHEETHAKQKHSIDILFMELLQIVFWFNPLIYILKRDIKLNHEFLADQAVIHQGITLTNYQQLLLEFSSSSSSNHLANAINYSLIKKRFTIMKTKTSNQSLGLRSLLLLPLLAILIYGFSTTKQVEKEVVSKMIINQTTKDNKLIQENNFISLNNQAIIKKELIIVIEVNKITINGKPSSIKTFKDDLDAATMHWGKTDYASIKPKVHITSSSQDFLNQVEKEFSKTRFSRANQGMKLVPPPPPAPKVIKGKVSDVPPPPAPRVKKREIRTPPPPPIPANATPEQRVKYEKAHEEYKAKRKEMSLIRQEKMIERESAMLERREKMAKREKELSMKERELRMVGRDKEKELYMKERELRMTENESKKLVREKERELDVKERELKMVGREKELAMKERELRMTENESKKLVREKERELMMKEREVQREHRKNTHIPKSPLDHVKDMSKKGATFYYNGEKISSNKAIKLVKKNKSLNISSNTNDGKSTVKISTKGIKLDN